MEEQQNLSLESSNKKPKEKKIIALAEEEFTLLSDALTLYGSHLLEHKSSMASIVELIPEINQSFLDKVAICDRLKRILNKDILVLDGSKDIHKIDVDGEVKLIDSYSKVEVEEGVTFSLEQGEKHVVKGADVELEKEKEKVEVVASVSDVNEYL